MRRESLALLVLLMGCARASAPRASAHPAPPGELLAQADPMLTAACTPSGPELCFNATDDNCNGLIDEGCGEHSGLVEFAIAWEEPHADVDLLVVDPNGELVEVGRTARSGLVKERDCPGRNNECHGQNFESVYLAEGDVLRGSYRVRVRLDSLGGENPPIRVAFGARIGQKTYSAGVALDAPGAERELNFGL